MRSFFWVLPGLLLLLVPTLAMAVNVSVGPFCSVESYCDGTSYRTYALTENGNVYEAVYASTPPDFAWVVSLDPSGAPYADLAVGYWNNQVYLYALSVGGAVYQRVGSGSFEYKGSVPSGGGAAPFRSITLTNWDQIDDIWVVNWHGDYCYSPDCGVDWTCYGPITGVSEADKRQSEDEAGAAQSVPNPFAFSSRLSYEVPAPGARAAVRVFDVRGRLVRTLVDGWTEPGQQFVQWDGRDSRGRTVPSGTYFYSVEVNGERVTKKTMIVR